MGKVNNKKFWRGIFRRKTVSIPNGKGKVMKRENKKTLWIAYQFPMGKVKFSVCWNLAMPAMCINSLWER